MHEEKSDDFDFDDMPALDLSLFDGAGTRGLPPVSDSSITISPVSSHEVTITAMEDVEAMINDPKDPRGTLFSSFLSQA